MSEPEIRMEAPPQMPVELVVHQSMMRIAKDLTSGGVELRLDTPIGLAVRVPFSEKGWAEFAANAQRAVSGVAVARTMPPGPSRA